MKIRITWVPFWRPLRWNKSAWNGHGVPPVQGGVVTSNQCEPFAEKEYTFDATIEETEAWIKRRAAYNAATPKDYSYTVLKDSEPRQQLINFSES